MCPIFKDNWVTYQEIDSEFKYNFGNFSHNTVGLQHAINQFKYLYDTTNLSAAITLSGGVDSQAVMLAAHLSKTPFQVYSLRFNNNLNEHDLLAGQLLANKLKIDINYVDINILNFYTSERYLNYIHPYRNCSPQIAALLWFYEQLGTTSQYVVASANPVIKHGNAFEGVNNYTLFAWERYSRINNVPIVGSFLWYSPELFGSLYRKFDEVQTDLYTTKCSIYQENGFEVIPQTQKYNGFEKVKE